MYKIVALAASLVTASFSNTIFAQDGSQHPLFEDDWLFRIGGQRASADVKVGLGNPTVGNIPVLDLDALGVDSDFNSGWLNVLWQAPERWSWGLTYFESKAEGQRLTDRDIEFGDITIPANSGVATEFDTKFYILNGYYDLYQRPDTTAGVGFGIYSLDLSMQVSKVINGQPTGEFEKADALAPLPTVSGYYKHAFNDKWAIMADASWFSANIDKYDGDVFAARVSLDYWFNENWGLGLGYTFVEIDLTIEETLFDQFYNVSYDSAFIYLTGGF